MEIDKENLEKALTNVGKDEPVQEEFPEEEIGFHKGALNTLAAERNELFKMLQNVEAIMQAHLKKLEEFGVKVPVKVEK